MIGYFNQGQIKDKKQQESFKIIKCSFRIYRKKSWEYLKENVKQYENINILYFTE